MSGDGNAAPMLGHAGLSAHTICDMTTDAPTNQTAAAGVPVAIVVSRYNGSITEKLLAGAIEAYEAAGGDRRTLAVIDAPGSFEIPVLAQAAAACGRFRAVVALGCLIRGQTRHDRVIAEAVAKGLMDVACATGVPVTFGVLTVDSAKQALARAGGAQGNKGADAMRAALHSAAVLEALALAASVGEIPVMPTIVVMDKAAKAGSTTDG